MNLDEAKRILSQVSVYVPRVSSTLSASQAVTELAKAAKVEDTELAAALALTGVADLAGRSLCPLPNDRPMLEAIRTNNAQAKASLRDLVARHPIGHAAAQLRCSATWVKAAIGVWRLKEWPRNKPSERTLDGENYWEQQPQGFLRDAIARAIHEYRASAEAAWSIGVSPRWFRARLRESGILPTSNAPITRQMPKAQVLQEIEQAGSVLAWAKRKGLVYHTALRRAKQVGYESQRTTKDDLIDALSGWLERTEYDSVDECDWVSTGYLLRQVMPNFLRNSEDGYRRAKVRAAMNELGYSLERRQSDGSWVWVPQVKAEQPFSLNGVAPSV